jgi:3alpha(or 20beta)-hydroxysteroid dehydrogenase
MKRLEGRVALVTGGARGQGAEHAKLFVQEGASVLVTDVLDELGSTLASDLQSKDFPAEYMHLDVSSSADWASAIDYIERRFGHLDILVNNAGVGSEVGVTDCTDAEWNRVIGINQTGTFYGMRAAVPAMLRSGGGAIINISSVYGGIGGVAGYIAYVATKSAVIAMTRSVALAHAKDGIRVNAVAPGALDTPMLRQEIEYHGIDLKAALPRIPIPRLAAAHETSPAVLFLASDEAAYITGIVVPVDGGYSVGMP